MNGIERLRELAQKHRIIEHYLTADTIDSIADQIERETQPKRDSAADVSMSAYDLLPQEDREAIAWVREHGGLDEVEAHWSGRVSLTSVKRMVALHKEKRDRLKAHALWLERKCGERRERIRELERNLAKSASDQLKADSALYDLSRELRDVCKAHGIDPGEDPLGALDEALDSRLMPEGMEWPRFEDDAPVRFLDDFERYGDENGVSVVTMYSDGSFALNCRAYSKGEHVNRPAPKVLDADGVEIRVGDEVFVIATGKTHHVTVIDHIGKRFKSMEQMGDDATWLDPMCFTHRAHVLAADGRPLREGETVWDTKGNGPYIIEGIENDGVVRIKGNDLDYFGADFTHERPDSLDRLAEDIGAMVVAWRSNRDLFDAQEAAAGCVGENTLGAALDSLVRRARALAGDA